MELKLRLRYFPSCLQVASKICSLAAEEVWLPMKRTDVMGSDPHALELSLYTSGHPGPGFMTYRYSIIDSIVERSCTSCYYFPYCKFTIFLSVLFVLPRFGLGNIIALL